MAWYKRSKLGFDVIFKITAPKPPVRNPVPIINQNNQSSKFTSSSNHLTNVSPFWSHRSSCFRCSGSGYRCYHVDRHSNSPNISFVIVLVGLGIGVATCFGSIETIPFTKRRHLVIISDNLERKIGVHGFKKMKARYKGQVLPEMHPQSVRVRMILKDVTDALQRDLNYASESGLKGVKLTTSHLQGLEWEVLVVKNHVVNACCFPGGKIVVFTGLLKHFRTDEEIATIIGHEVAHAVARHVAEMFTKILWHALLLLIWDEIVRPDHSNAALYAFLLNQAFSRRMEIEADYIGLLLMASAGYDPRVAPKVFNKMGQMLGDSTLYDYLSTHPLDKTRSKLLSEASVMQEAISMYEDAIARREVDT